MTTPKQLLVVGAIAAVVGVTTFAVVRSGMRSRCRQRVRSAVGKLPLVTEKWKREQERKICVGQRHGGGGGGGQLARHGGGRRHTARGLAVGSEARGMRQRQGASHQSVRDAIAGSFDAGTILQSAFTAGATSVTVYRTGEDRYNATVSSSKYEHKDGRRTVMKSAFIDGKGRDADSAIADALTQLTREQAIAQAQALTLASRSTRR